MLIVVVEVGVNDGAIDRVKDTIKMMEDETRKEAGCTTYAFSIDINDANTVRIIERWESMDALRAHFKSPHMAAFNTALGDLQPTSFDVKCYDIAGELELPM